MTLIDYKAQLPYVSDEEFLCAQENLNKNMKQKSFFRKDQYSIYKGVFISEDHSGENLRRSYYVDCEFSKSNLTNVGLSGSIINSSNFSENIFSNTKLDSCELDECNFINEKLTYVNFSKSIISNSIFKDCEMEAVNFTDTLFENVSFVNCVWKSLSLENAVFCNTSFDSVDLRKLNFEFSQFHNVHMNNVRLPFPTIPYIINGLEYLMNTSDDIWVSSAQSPIGRISKEEYLTYIYDLEKFYIKTQNYFPLANIYIAKKQWEEAFSAIISGIQFSIRIIRNFRLVYYYCKLLQFTKSFSADKLSSIYDYINKNISDTNLRHQDYYNYTRYIDSIRNTLMNKKDSSSLQFFISTNILSAEYNKLSILTSIFDEIVNYVNKEYISDIKYYVEMRHGSPYDFFIKFFGSTDSLLHVLAIVSGTIWGITYLIDKIQDLENKRLDNKKKELEIKEKEIDIKQKEFELNYLKNEKYNKDREIGLEMLQKLNEHNIYVINGSHTFIDSNNNNIIHEYRAR